MFRRFDFISGGMNKHSMIQRWTAIAGIFIFTALIIAGCMKNESPQKQVTEIDPNVATEELTLKVGGMVWSKCVSRVQSALIKVVGVRKADVSLEKNEAVVIYEQGKVTESQLTGAVIEAGFQASIKG